MLEKGRDRTGQSKGKDRKEEMGGMGGEEKRDRWPVREGRARGWQP